MKFKRNRSKVVKILGTWWFKEISYEDMNNQRDNLITIKTGIHNEKQLADFMAKEQSIRDDLDNVQWRCFLFEDYSPTESIFVYKAHHCVADGIGFILMMSNLVDSPDIKDFPQVTMRFPLWQRFFINLFVPFMVLWISFKLQFLTRNENNGVKNSIIS